MRKVLIILLCILPVIVSAQYYSTGQDPASIHWKQIRTPLYRIIYPSGSDSNARRLSGILDYIIPFETQSLTSTVPGIPFILHTQTVSSNGITVWAPRRIELYTCPPQDSYAEEWIEQLAIHEYRHVVQTAKMNRHFSRFLYYLFGEQITGAILGLYVPAWFLEGDATVIETALSNSGRGRLPSFSAPLRAQLLEKGLYSYDKAVLGSYKTFTPNAYTLGYNLVAMGRLKYGTELWNYSLDRVSRYPFMIVPFASGIKIKTGLSKTGFYKSALGDLKSKWEQQDRETKLTEFRMITRPNRKNYSIYQHPLHQNDSLFIAMKKSMDETDHFVRIDKSGKEKKLLVPGDYQEGSTSIGKDKLVWTEVTPDIRWDNRNYLSIRLMDLNTGKTKTLIRHSRFQSPCITVDGKKIIAVNSGINGQHSLVLLDACSGKVLKIWNAPSGVQILAPVWNAEGTRIAFTWLDARGNSIGLFDPDSGIFSSILPFSYHQISGPSFWGKNYILFSSDYSGIENLYILNIPFKKMYQVTSSRFGAYDPDFSIHTSRFIYTDSGADGFQIAEARIDSTAWIPVDRITDNSYRLFEAMAEQEKVNVQDSVLQHGTKYSEHETLDSVCKYSKLGHLFNFHSWAPVSFSAGNLDMSPGIMVLSQNDLSTMIVSAGYDYNLNEKTGKYYTTLSYKGLYPVLDFHFDIGNRAGYAITSFRNEKVRFTWQEMNLSTSVSIPWNFSFGNYYRYLTPSIGTTLIYAKHHSSTPEYFNQGLIQSLDYKLSFFQYTRSSGKDIYPRWGQTFFFVYRSTPFTKNDMGSVLGIETRFYFPGMFGHHGIRIYGAFQNHYNPGTLSYRYADVITYPRGYYDIFDPKIYSLSFNYAMPLFYPDWSLGSLLYFKRVRMNLFFDYAESWRGNYQERFTSGVYKSTGVELTTDFHLLRFLYPIALGMRSTYFPHDNSWGFELTYSISY